MTVPDVAQTILSMQNQRHAGRRLDEDGEAPVNSVHTILI